MSDSSRAVGDMVRAEMAEEASVRKPVSEEVEEAIRRRLDDEHFPWSYTEIGARCICGEWLDADETCPSLRVTDETFRNGSES